MALLTAHQLLFSVAAAGWALALAFSAARTGRSRRWVSALRPTTSFLALFGAIGALHLNPSAIRGPWGQAHVALVVGLLAADVTLTLWGLRRAQRAAEAVDG